MTKPTKWHVQPGKTQISLGPLATFEPHHDKTNKMACTPREESVQSAQSDQSLRCPHGGSLDP